MGQIRTTRPALLILAAFSRHEDARDWVAERCAREWGPVELASPVFDFDQTEFYVREMGAGLKKWLLGFQQPMDPACLAELKLLTNQWEEEYREQSGHPESRPLNLDPGYVTEAKLVLASTKDRDHRIYLQQGIYAEVTLYYHAGKWCTRPWTYPDYQTPGYLQFLNECRQYLRTYFKQHGV